MKKILFAILMLGLTVSLSACERKPTAEDQTMVDKFLVHIAAKTVEYKAGKIDLDGKGSLESGGNKASLKGTTKVSFDSTDANNSKSSIKLDLKGDGTIEGKSANLEVKGEVRTVNKKLYVFLEDLGVDSSDATTGMMASMVGGYLKGKWNEIPGAIDASDATTLDTQNVSPEQIKTIASNNSFLKVVNVVGNRTYEVKIDAAKLKKYLSDLGEANKTPATQEDLAGIDQLITSLGEYYLELQIDENSELTHFKTDITVSDPEKSQQLKVKIDASLDGDSTEGSFDLTVDGDEPASIHLEGRADHRMSDREDIEAPADAKVFDLGAIMGGLGAGIPSPEGMEVSP
jgi:hypothetical protein